MNYDIKLVSEAKNGNKQSFAALYEQVSLDLYKMALYTVGNSHDAEDVVAETFVEAWKGIHNLKKDDSFKPWILKILSVRCKRKFGDFTKARKNIDIDDMIGTPSDVNEDFSEDFSDNLVIAKAMDSLTPDERQMIVLSVLHGYTTKEISEIMEKPHGTVCSKVSRTLKKLRTYLETNLYEKR